MVLLLLFALLASRFPVRCSASVPQRSDHCGVVFVQREGREFTDCCPVNYNALQFKASPYFSVGKTLRLRINGANSDIVFRDLWVLLECSS